MKKSTLGALLLLLATIVWGVAFVAQTSAADVIGSFTFNAARSLIAAALLSAILFGKEKVVKKRRLLGEGAAIEGAERKKFIKKSLLSGGLCGVALFVAVNFQQFGIERYPEGVAASGRAGFLTATYVVFVAVYTAIKRREMPVFTAISCAVCVAGMYLLCMSGSENTIYFGDVLEVLGALGFTVQILVIDRFSSTDGIALSCGQFWVTGIISAVCALIFEEVRIADLAAAWLPIAYAGVLSSCVGYTLQILGQKSVSPAVTSVIMSLESVFAALAGWVILNERLAAKELIGCALVFIAVILSQISPQGGEKAAKETKEKDTKETAEE